MSEVKFIIGSLDRPKIAGKILNVHCCSSSVLNSIHPDDPKKGTTTYNFVCVGCSRSMYLTIINKKKRGKK